MKSLITQLTNDDAGFIVSAELVLVSTIAILSMVVGLAEVADNVNQELEDVGSAFASINQTYEFAGYEGHAGLSCGSSFEDDSDHCDDDCDIRHVNPTDEGDY